jgi:hypothetical protein
MRLLLRMLWPSRYQDREHVSTDSRSAAANLAQSAGKADESESIFKISPFSPVLVRTELSPKNPFFVVSANFLYDKLRQLGLE